MLEISTKVQIAISILITGAAGAALLLLFHRYLHTSEKHFFLIWLVSICSVLAASYVFLLPLITIFVPIGILVIGYFSYKWH